MRRQSIIILLLLAGISFQSFGQSFKKQFDDLLARKDTSGQINLLKKWEAKNSNDAELYAAYFNYFVSKSRMEIMGTSKRQKGKDSFQIADSISKAVGTLNDKIMPGDKYINPGFTYIDKGLSKYPSRLDMRLGKVSVFGEIKDYQNFTGENS